MNISLRIFVMAIGVFVFVAVVNMLIRKKMTESGSLMWFLVAFITLLSGFFPTLINNTALALGISYPPTLIFVVSTVAFMLILFKHTSEISIMGANINELASYISILRKENEELRAMLDEDK